MSKTQQLEHDHDYPYPRSSPRWRFIMWIVFGIIASVSGLLWACSGITNDALYWQIVIGTLVSLSILFATIVQSSISHRQWKAMRKGLRQATIVERPILVVRNVSSESDMSGLNSIPYVVVRNKGRTAAKNLRIFIEMTEIYEPLVFPKGINKQSHPAKTLPMLGANEREKFTGALLSKEDGEGVRISGRDRETLPVATIYGYGFYESLSGDKYDLEPFAFDYRYDGEGWRPAYDRIGDDKPENQSEAAE